jgi:hypothetical protein
MENDMKNILRAAAVLAFACALSACSAWTAVENAVAPVAASIGDALVPPSVQTTVANAVAAAENLYTAATKVLTSAITNKLLTKEQANSLGALEAKTYAALVTLRTDVQQNKDVTAALDAYKKAYGDLSTAASADGVALPAYNVPTPTAPASTATTI